MQLDAWTSFRLSARALRERRKLCAGMQQKNRRCCCQDMENRTAVFTSGHGSAVQYRQTAGMETDSCRLPFIRR